MIGVFEFTTLSGMEFLLDCWIQITNIILIKLKFIGAEIAYTFWTVLSQRIFGFQGNDNSSRHYNWNWNHHNRSWDDHNNRDYNHRGWNSQNISCRNSRQIPWSSDHRRLYIYNNYYQFNNDNNASATAGGLLLKSFQHTLSRVNYKDLICQVQMKTLSEWMDKWQLCLTFQWIKCTCISKTGKVHVTAPVNIVDHVYADRPVWSLQLHNKLTQGRYRFILPWTD